MFLQRNRWQLFAPHRRKCFFQFNHRLILSLDKRVDKLNKYELLPAIKKDKINCVLDKGRLQSWKWGLARMQPTHSERGKQRLISSEAFVSWKLCAPCLLIVLPFLRSWEVITGALTFPPFSSFYRTVQVIGALDSRWVETQIRGSLASQTAARSCQHWKKKWEYVRSIAFFLFTEEGPHFSSAPAALATDPSGRHRPSRQNLVGPYVPVAGVLFFESVRHTGRSHPAEKAVILGSVHAWMHIWWQTLQQNT